MKATEQANQLIQKFELIDREYRYQDELNLFEAKQCALICVDEITEYLEYILVPNPFTQYWKEVREEIENL
jgi:hypothetical protein